MVFIDQLINSIDNYKKIIVANIDFESIKSYDYIQKQFLISDVTSNNLFQSTYNSFYRLNGTGLTKEFKSNYFKVLQEKRKISVFSRKEIKDILLNFYEFRSAKGYHCIHFSFTTKLIHTVSNSFPIYDSKIKKVFSFKGPHPYHGKNDKINMYIAQHELIISVYNKIIEENLLEEAFNIFNQKFSNYYLNKVKILDFIFWTAGKLNIE